MKIMSNREDLYKKFIDLSPTNGESNEFTVDTIIERRPHKIGVSPEGHVMIFVECSDEKVTSNIKLKMFNVTFNRLCKLNNHDNTVEKKYGIIKLISNNIDIQKYFLDVMCIVIKKLPVLPKVEQLKREVSKIVSLFTSMPQISKEAVKGLWAELFLIERSSNPLYLLKSWHVSTEDKYDFNDGVDKIEVKSTSNEERIHHFAIEQLHPNKESQLLIASLIVVNSGLGIGIFNLVDSISSRISDTDALLKLNEEVLQTIGCHIEEAKEIKYDYTYAKDNLKFFDYKVVPAIDLKNVPLGVSSVHFASCLKGLDDVKVSKLSGNLFNSL